MDDPAEQAHFRKIVAAFFFYQVSISSDSLLAVSARSDILTRFVPLLVD